MKPIWYETTSGELVNLNELVRVTTTCPADQRFFTKQPNGEDTAFVDGYMPCEDQYGSARIYLFSGPYSAVQTEFTRIKKMLL